MLEKQKEYYIGLDVGTESVGWAVSDLDYNICKFNGKEMWGVRLFDEAKDASDRRKNRTARRRLARRKERLLLLEILFKDEISKVDPNFLVRMKESSLHFDDKSSFIGKYSLFNDYAYNDKNYMSNFPTIYHLRSKLVHSQECFDIRLIYLALHHILKNRGHFLYDSTFNGNEQSLLKAIDFLNLFLQDYYNVSLDIIDKNNFEDILVSDEISVFEKKKRLKALIRSSTSDDPLVNISVVVDALAGATVKFSDLFMDDSLKSVGKKSVCLKSNIEEDIDSLYESIDNRVELILELKSVFDLARLSQIKGNYTYLSDAKIAQFEKNKEHLSLLKKYVRENEPDKYDIIFKTKQKGVNNIPAFIGYKTKSGDYCCGQEEFCLFLKSQLCELQHNVEYQKIYNEIDNKTFLTKLKGVGNGVIPRQLHRIELIKILENACKHYDFLNQTDESGISVKDKIISLFDFKIPYYVGPLSKNSKTGWIIRDADKIYPWNFDKVVDVELSAEKFIENLISICSYTGEKVLPKDSLLYSEFRVLNEINLIRINGRELPFSVKQNLYSDLFVNSKKKVTKKSLSNYFKSIGVMQENDEITGVDDIVKSSLKSLHDFKLILTKTQDTAMVESIIRAIVVFGEDKKMLKNWIQKNCSTLDENDISYICRLKYSDWGRLSKRFLTGIYHVDKDGVAYSIMDMLRNNNVNLMQLLSSEYTFAQKASEILEQNLGCDYDIHKRIEDMYISPSVKRSVWQTLRIINEIVKIQKCPPRKIFIEVARGSKEEVKKRTESRKDKLIELYKNCHEESSELFNKLCNEDDSKLRSDKLYLYYTQFGKCMYSGDDIDIESLLKDNMQYDIDHIYPRSRIKDDSIDNRVLVRSELNREKTNIYPISEDIRNKMRPFWHMLKDKNLISEKKYARLVRETPLTDKELHEFVARQLVETQQSTKAIANMLKDIFPETRIVYSKAGNVADFRQEFNLIKCREVNDLHHAKDAYLNVVVGNVYDTKFTENFFKNIHNENYSLNKVFEFDTPNAWKKGETIKVVKTQMSKNRVLFTRMPIEEKGELFDLQLMPATKGQLPVKKGRDIDKYGGYNKISGTYFFAVEHTEKKKRIRIRTIEPVYLYAKDIYERDPIYYCTEYLKLSEPEIICSKIRKDALLEIDCKKVFITGRTGDRFICKHAYQLSVDTETESYIKNINKYVSRCVSAKKELAITKRDGISFEENLKLYEIFVEKLSAAVYIRLFSNLKDFLTYGKEKFINLSALNQCKVLLEILKIFKCDRQTTNLELLDGVKNAGIIIFGKNISSCQSAYLINQSITGLFESKTDLLK